MNYFKIHYMLRLHILFLICISFFSDIMQAVNIEHKKFFDSSSMEKQDQLLKKVENIASNQDYSDDDYEKCVRLAHTVNKKYSANVPANFINQPTQNQQDYQRIIALGHDVNKRYSAKHKNLFFPKVINVEEKIKESIKEKDKKGLKQLIISP